MAKQGTLLTCSAPTLVTNACLPPPVATHHLLPPTQRARHSTFAPQAQQGEDIPDAVKRYRQSIFKLDYKVKKFVKERRTHRGGHCPVAGLLRLHTGHLRWGGLAGCRHAGGCLPCPKSTNQPCSPCQPPAPCLMPLCAPPPFLPAGAAAAAALAPTDKAHTIRQLGVGTPANHLLGLLCTDGDTRRGASKEPSPKEEQEQ